MRKLDELRKALSRRGAKAKISKDSGLSLAGLHYIQSGKNLPNDSTRRLIARALGFPDDYFLEPDDQPERTARRRIVIEMDIPPDFRLDEGRLDRIREAMVDAGNHIINTIREIDRESQGRPDGEHSTKSS